jgi:hypothetical protein
MKKIRLQSNRRGIALPLALLVIVLLLITGSTLLSMGVSSRIFSVRNTSDIKARCAADAGLTRALFEMNEKLKIKPWNDISLPRALNTSLDACDATYSYIVTGDLENGYVITSVGESGNATRVVQAALGFKGAFEHAILTKDLLIMKSDTIIDGYNSKDPLDSEFNVSIGSQSTVDSSVILNNNSTVDGDVLVGIGGNPNTAIKNLGAIINGDQRAVTTKDPLPKINAPALDDKMKSITAKGETITITPADNGTYTAIDIQKGTKTVPGVGKVDVPTALEIDGGDVVLYVTGNIELDQACDINVKDGSSLTLYIDGDILCREGSGINIETSSKEAAIIKLFATGEDTQNFDVRANSKWTGVIYAPNADVQLYANGDAYGSVVASSFEFKAGGNYHYDEALRQVTEQDEGVTFTVTHWSEENITLSASEIKEQILN